eukprot:CFRG4221T1
MPTFTTYRSFITSIPADRTIYFLDTIPVTSVRVYRSPMDKNEIEEKPYRCVYNGCKAAFIHHSALKTHSYTHSGERPYKCEHASCAASFAHPSNLATHKRIHTGEKPYVCKQEGCNAAFAQSSNLTRHIRSHTKQKPYICDFCMARYSSLRSRSRHMLSHERVSNETPHMGTISATSSVMTDEENCNLTAKTYSPETSMDESLREDSNTGTGINDFNNQSRLSAEKGETGEDFDCTRMSLDSAQSSQDSFNARWSHSKGPRNGENVVPFDQPYSRVGNHLIAQNTSKQNPVTALAVHTWVGNTPRGRRRSSSGAGLKSFVRARDVGVGPPNATNIANGAHNGSMKWKEYHQGVGGAENTVGGVNSGANAAPIKIMNQLYSYSQSPSTHSSATNTPLPADRVYTQTHEHSAGLQKPQPRSSLNILVEVLQRLVKS